MASACWAGLIGVKQITSNYHVSYSDRVPVVSFFILCFPFPLFLFSLSCNPLFPYLFFLRYSSMQQRLECYKLSYATATIIHRVSRQPVSCTLAMEKCTNDLPAHPYSTFLHSTLTQKLIMKIVLPSFFGSLVVYHLRLACYQRQLHPLGASVLLPAAELANTKIILIIINVFL